uniref:Uncharacterized protein n=1 Tax=viral metagenome TaxID=1070528 RepID=A0A6C0AF15_9ZZZZ
MFCCRKANLDIVDGSIKIDIPIEITDKINIDIKTEIDIIEQKIEVEISSEETKIDLEISPKNIDITLTHDDKIIVSTE